MLASPQFEVLEPRVLLSGTVYIVDSLEDIVETDSMVTLREAIQAASQNMAVTDDVQPGTSDKDEIFFSPSLFDAGPAEIRTGNLSCSGTLSITGPGPDALRIRSYGSRVFRINNNSDLELRGIAISGVFWDYSGAVENNGTATIVDCVLEDNQAQHGGAIYKVHPRLAWS